MHHRLSNICSEEEEKQAEIVFFFVFFPEIGWWGWRKETVQYLWLEKETLNYLLTGKQEVVFPKELNKVRTKSGFIISCRAHSGLSKVHTELRKATCCHPAELECFVGISYLWAPRLPCVNLRYDNEAEDEDQPVKAHLFMLSVCFFCSFFVFQARI